MSNISDQIIRNLMRLKVADAKAHFEACKASLFEASDETRDEARASFKEARDCYDETRRMQKVDKEWYKR